MVSSEKEEVEDKDEFGGVLLRIIVKVLLKEKCFEFVIHRNIIRNRTFYRGERSPSPSNVMVIFCICNVVIDYTLNLPTWNGLQTSLRTAPILRPPRP